MFRFLPLILLCFVTGIAQAQTFEIQDPAQQFFEDKEKPANPETSPDRAPIKNLACTVDIDTGACYCVDKRSDALLDMMPEECAAIVRSALDEKESL